MVLQSIRMYADFFFLKWICAIDSQITHIDLIEVDRINNFQSNEVFVAAAS